MSASPDNTARWTSDGRVVYSSRRGGPRTLYAQKLGSHEDPQPVVPPPAWFQEQVLTSGDFLFYRAADADGGPLADRPWSGMGRLMLRHGDDEREILRAPTSHVAFNQLGRPIVRCGASDPAKCVLGKFKNGASTLARIDLATGSVDAPFFTTTDRLKELAVSPDGSTAMLAIQDKETLISINVKSGESRTFFTKPAVGLITHVVFMPDGKGLILTGEGFEAGSYGMIHTDLEGKGEVLFTSNNSRMSEPAVSPDGKWVAYDNTAYDTDVWLIEPE
jgi:WD40 repeat protein